MNKTIAGLLCLLLCGFCAAPAIAADDPLAGLWTAKRWFGPFARGTLVIEGDGGAWRADIVGFRVPVAAQGPALSFDLPGERGNFRGTRLKDGSIAGHWFQPLTPLFGRYASPVHLRAAGRGRWQGEVVPYDDVFTFHLRLTPRADGSLDALLVNPERDLGPRLGVERLVRSGNRVSLRGRQRPADPEAEITTGVFDPEQDTLTLLFANRGGTYDFHRDGDASDFYPRGRPAPRYAYLAPVPRDDGWPVAALEDVGIDRAGIGRAVQLLLDAPVEQPATPKVHALLIARHGKLVLEEYFHGEHRDRMHETRSAAKVVTTTLVGAALHAGAPFTLSTPVYQSMNGGAFPEGLEPAKRAMTLEHLLTMSSGYFCDDTNPDAPGNEDAMLDQQDEPDYYRYTLAVPMATLPGQKAVYCSINPNLALGVVGREMHEFAPAIFDRLVAGPMQISRYAWPVDPAGNPYGGGGVRFLPRDFMKLGQLMLDGGSWHGHRVLDRDFARRAVAPLYHLRGLTYGYLWWSVDYPYKDRTVHAFYAGGAGGQSVVVFPELDLVIASFGASYSSGAGTFYMQRTVIPRDLLPAVREKGDDPHAPVVPRADFAPKLGPTDDGSAVKGG